MLSYLKCTFLNYAFIWGLVLLHIYVLILAPTATAYQAHSAPSRCPFKLARQLLTQPTALMATSLRMSDVISPLQSFKRFPQLRTLVGPLQGPQHFNDFHACNTALSCHQGIEPHHRIVVDQPVDTDPPPAPALPPAGTKKKKKALPDGLEIMVIGLSHHTAKVEVREQLAIPEDQWAAAAAALCEYEAIAEASVLSTCNRFEIYLAGQNPYEVMRDAMLYLSQRTAIPADALRKHLFLLTGEDAIWHLLRVSAGLDSLIVGEGQILAQVKKSYEHSLEGAGGKVISKFLNVGVSAGKRVRSETGISRGAVSISSAAAEFSALRLVEDQLGPASMKEAEIAVIGAGKMARLLLIHLQTQGVKKVTIVNRSLQRIEELAQEMPDLQIVPKTMESLWEVVGRMDIVYPSTASAVTIINPDELKDAIPKEKRVQFVDISVPRNVHPDCSLIAGVFCYNVDDLKAVVERNTAKRRKEVIEAEVILRDEMSKFRLWQQSLGAIPTITKLQEKAEALRQEEMAKAMKKLAALSAKDLETVERITKGIVAKLLHGPMNHLRQQTEGDATRAAIKQVQQAFQLTD